MGEVHVGGPLPRPHFPPQIPTRNSFPQRFVFSSSYLNLLCNIEVSSAVVQLLPAAQLAGSAAMERTTNTGSVRTTLTSVIVCPIDVPSRSLELVSRGQSEGREKTLRSKRYLEPK